MPHFSVVLAAVVLLAGVLQPGRLVGVSGQVFYPDSPFVGPEPISAGDPSSAASRYYKNGLSLVGRYGYPQLSWPASNVAATQACGLWLPVGDGMMNNVSCDVYSFLDLGFQWANSSDPVQQANGYSLLDLTFGFLNSGRAVAQISDVWGYDDPQTGRAFALVGAGNGLSIVDVTVPRSPVEVAYFAGAYSVWRDIKTRGSYVYYVQDNTDYLCSPPQRFPNVNASYCPLLYPTDGLSIVDMTRADSPRLVRHDTSLFHAAHNLFVEVDADRPYAYACGGDVTPNGGVAVIDLHDPERPLLLASFDDTYIHDVMVQRRGDRYILYGAAIYQPPDQPSLYLYDVTDPAQPQLITARTSTYRWLHNVWPTPDSRYLYTTHEENGYPITVWDATDLTDVREVNFLFLTPGNDDISAHNAFVRGHRLFISYYSMGTVVYDLSADPTRPVLVAQYDTWPQSWQNAGGLNGNWGVYPFAAARQSDDDFYVYSSDVDNGLFVTALNPYQIQPAKQQQHLTWFIVVTFLVLGALSVAVVYLLYLHLTNKSTAQYEQLVG